MTPSLVLLALIIISVAYLPYSPTLWGGASLFEKLLLADLLWLLFKILWTKLYELNKKCE